MLVTVSNLACVGGVLVGLVGPLLFLELGQALLVDQLGRSGAVAVMVNNEG